MIRDIKGERNPRWNGGTSEYPGHAEFKRNRIIKLKETAGKCEICGNRATVVHHVDESKENHALENMIPLCRKCHGTIHNCEEGGNRTSKYKRLYGMTIKEISGLLEGSTGWVYKLEKDGLLKKSIEKARAGKEKP